MTLSMDDFDAFFEGVHGHAPFPWQRRLLRTVATEGRWPSVLDLPTGSGKTAAIDIAVFHLALDAESADARRAPVRIVFVVDRRLVVDDAYARARRIEDALRNPKWTVGEHVAKRLRSLGCEGARDAAPLLARRLRGGIPRESDWARTPTQPTVLCSTVDQIGSRLLFRGYGVSDSMKPVHAGLLGADCLVLLDEAHLAEPFKQTLGWIARYHGKGWRQEISAPPWSFSLLTATPGDQHAGGFALDANDLANPVLSRRLRASKPALLVKVGKTRPEGDTPERGKTSSAKDDLSQRVRAIVAELRSARQHFADPKNGATAPAIGIVVNRVTRARALHDALREELRDAITSGEIDEPILMIGAARSIDRDSLASELGPIRTRTWSEGESRRLARAIIIVATQCIEAGVDIDFDAVITEAAPVDALRQRFGRLNRAGRDLRAFASVVAMSSDLATRYDDPVYDKSIKAAWDYLYKLAETKSGTPPTVDVGPSALSLRETEHPVPADALSRKYDAPILLPAHVDLFSQTSPIPSPDPEVALYLHGPERQPDAVSVVWRADIDAQVDVRGLLTLVPPRSAEAVELPVWAVRRWLLSGELGDLPDVATPVPGGQEEERMAGEPRRVFLWRGDHEASRWIGPDEVHPGATVIVPSSYGGLDRFGWDPDSNASVLDMGREAARGFSGRRFVVRLAPGLVGAGDQSQRLATVVAEHREARWSDLRDALLELPLTENLRADLKLLGTARRRRVVAYTDLYGQDRDGRPRGVVFLAPLGLAGGSQTEDVPPSSTEDDTAGSLPGYSLSLEQHREAVATCAERFARAAGLPEPLAADIKVAGYLHDAGKADRRFQAWLQYGDPLGPDGNVVLAKSARRLPRKARAASGLPERWRHEALSVRLARSSELFAAASDPMLVLWLVGTHHGFGRPFFPHHDPLESPSEVGPQSLAFEWRALDWPSIFERLKARYGVWELARTEAILRLADHRASEARAAKGSLE